jgi:3-hydroxyisobutyrate dehydrogenase-like beta-hydroxyacid dehydrogenase
MLPPPQTGEGRGEERKMETTAKIGVVGLGLVGKALARRIIAAGHRVVGYDVDPDAREAAHSLGVEVVDGPDGVARASELIFLSLPSSKIVDDVLWRTGALGAACAAGTTILDTTTSAPQETVSHHRRLAERSIRFVDVPLVGSSEDIARGRGVSIVGARREDADYIDLLASFSERIFFFGSAGQGHRVKLIVNLALGLHRIVASESLGLASKSGLDLHAVLDVLKASAASSRVMVDQGEKMLSSRFEEPSARLMQHAKDVRLILDLAAEVGARAPMSSLHDELLKEAIDAGWGPLDNAAVINLYIPPR